MTLVSSLAPEWQRIQLLGTCLSTQRRGETVAEDIKERLQALHQKVLRLREQWPWRDITQLNKLSPLDQDILACVVAPEADPRIGWTYQELQPGLASPYPSVALVRELLFLDVGEAGVFHGRFAESAPLRQFRLLDRITEIYDPLRPTARTRSFLLGWHNSETTMPPGTIELPVRAIWNDLVLPESCKQGLEELLLWVQQRNVVELEWGGQPSGGPIALLCGPSGTGKTFAAEVIAGALGYRLLRIDLGLLVSKYVGETEKNLNALFDAVVDEPVLLLFDEADSLFGRRGELKEARDRYANMEVSHLLTRIERHRGPCILTTNLRQHIDSAFLRRFHAVIEFPCPDLVARIKLWDQHLPPHAPRTEDVDIELLAQAVVLTGGQIRNSALRAAFLAAGDTGVVGLKHLACGIWRELAKDGRELHPSMLGELSKYLSEV
jgi:hypothetical protein